MDKALKREDKAGNRETVEEVEQSERDDYEMSQLSGSRVGKQQMDLKYI